MAEYIEREALLQTIDETVLFTVRESTRLPTPEMRGANKVIDRIKSAPTVDVVEIKHGKWVKKYPQYKNDGIYRCSCCKNDIDIATGEETPIDRGFYYCPNCGAEMDGAK